MRKKSKILNWLVKDSDSPISEKQQCQSIRDKELTKSPVTGSYIIRDWKKSAHTKPVVDWNKIAADFVEITPQSRAKLAKISNKIGPYECKLCKFEFSDAFELALHNCPRIVDIEYK